MTSETVTIRVSKATRDTLARLATEQGVSLASMLDKISCEREVEAIFESERKARQVEAGDLAAEAEMHLWETTLEDGID